MHDRYSWQQSAVALFSATTARLEKDARQLGVTVGWLKPKPAIDTFNPHASWLASSLRARTPANTGR